MLREYKLIIDSREKAPLWGNTIVRTMKTGDYSIELDGESHEDRISIERKSPSDLFGTLGKGHKRFKAQLERALLLDYFAIVVEGSYTSCYNKDFPGAEFSKMRGYVITSIIFTIHIKYDIPIFFTNGRYESKRIIKELFNAYVKNLEVPKDG